MLRRLVPLLALVALLASACSGGERPDPPAPSTGTCPEARTSSGTTNHAIDVDGERRGYLVQTPGDYDGSRPLPVVYVLHGLGGQADTTLAYTGLGAEAEEHGFIVVAPQAEGETPQWDFRTPASEEGSDADFLTELVAEVAQMWCVDEDRQFAAGLSNGSALVLALACSGEFPFRAYGAVAASFYEPAECEDAPPASIVYFHGRADQVVPFEGGPTPIEPAPPVEQSMQRWAAHNRCASEPVVAEVGSDVEHRTWQDCADAARLEAYYVDDGGHTWPGATPIPTLGGTTASINASAVMTEFFGLAD